MTRSRNAERLTRAQLRAFVDSVDLVKQRLGATPASPAQIAALRSEIISEIVKTTLGIVEPYLEPQVFGRVGSARGLEMTREPIRDPI